MPRILFVITALMFAFQQGFSAQYYYKDLMQYNELLFEKTEQLLDLNELDNALTEIQQIKANQTLTSDDLIYANILHSKCYKLMFKPNNSIDVLNTFEEHFQNKFDTTSFIYCIYLDEKADVFYRDKQNEKSQALLESSLSKKIKLLGENHPEVGITYGVLGAVYYYGYYNYRTAEDYYDKSFNICTQESFKDDYLKSRAYFNVAAIYYTKKEISKAKELLLSAQQIQEQSGVIDLNYLANIYSFLATLTSYNDKDTTAISLIETAYKIRSSSNYINKRRFNQSIYILALTYFDYNKNNKAIAFIKEQLSLLKRKEKNDENKRQIALLNMELARNYAILGKQDVSFQILNEYFDKLDFYFKPFLSERALYFNKFANVYFNIGKTNKAIDILKRAIEFINTEEAEISKSANIESMLYKNLAKFSASKADNDIGALKTAIEYFTISDSLMITYKMSTPWQSSKIEIAEAKKDLYDFAISSCLEYFKKTKDYYGVERAYNFMESSKAFTLIESLNQSLLLKLEGLDEAEKIKLREAKQNLYYLEKKHNKNTSYEISTQLENARIEIDKIYEQIESNLIETNSKMFFDTKIELGEFQKHILADQLNTIFYQHDSIFYRLKIYHNKVEFDAINSDSLIQSTINEFTTYVPKIHASNEVRKLEQDLYVLYQKLIGEIGANIKSLVIVPDGILNNFPFNSLVVSPINDKEIVHFKDLNYLLKDKTINYAYSTRFLIKRNAINKNSKAKRSFGVFNLNDNLIDSKEEIKFLSKTLPQFKYNQNLSKSNIIDEIKDKDILHFSLHGKYNNELKNVSLILDDSTRIYGYEIGAIQLQSRLAFLNSCDGNIGNYVTGEGVFSMSRYFMHAGCPTIVASIWKIPNKVSSDISKGFYSNLKKQNTVSVSISKAQLNYLNNNSIDNFLKHPYYWAGLIPIGIDQQIGLKRPLRFNFIIIISILLLLILAAIGYYKHSV